MLALLSAFVGRLWLSCVRALEAQLPLIAWCVIAFFVGMFARETFEAVHGNLVHYERSNETASIEVFPN